jgi:hypothetical protein
MKLSATSIFTNITQEKGFELAEELSNLKRHDTPSTTVFFGRHCRYGDIFIVIPNVRDEAIILPIAFQRAA